MKKWLIVCCALLLLCGCAKQEKTVQEFFAMDTVISLTLWSDDAAAEMQFAADTLREIENALSVTRTDSEIARLNANGSGEVSEETAAILSRALKLEEETGGACSPSLYTLTSLWGFTTDTQQVPCENEILRVLTARAAGGVTLNGTDVTLDGVKLDFGAFAKGYAAQMIAENLKKSGVPAVLSLGGNVQTIGEKPDGTPWQIGIRDPHDVSRNLGILSLGEGAVVTSGGYQRYFEENGKRYIHILDPETGYPADNGLASVTIVAQDGLLADAFSTALYVMGFEDAADFWRTRGDFEAIFVLEDGAIHVTEGLRDCFAGGEFTVLKR